MNEELKRAIEEAVKALALVDFYLRFNLNNQDNCDLCIEIDTLMRCLRARCKTLNENDKLERTNETDTTVCPF